MYLYIKTLHILAVVTFITGALGMALMVRTATVLPDDIVVRRLGQSMLRWDGLVTTPALAVVWMAGFTMAFGVGWSNAPWLLVKMISVIFITGLHCLESFALRKLLQEETPVRRLFTAAPHAMLAAFAVVAWLAIVKPF